MAHDQLRLLESTLAQILSEGFAEALTRPQSQALQLVDTFCAQLIEIVSRQGPPLPHSASQR